MQDCMNEATLRATWARKARTTWWVAGLDAAGLIALVVRVLGVEAAAGAWGVVLGGGGGGGGVRAGGAVGST
jgi:hypothetical protein